MLLKSRNKTVEEIIKLFDKEIFRAYHKAMLNGDIDLCLLIYQRLTPERRWKLSNSHSLYLSRLLALQMILINKASLAINFYNSLLSTYLGIKYPKELFGKRFTEQRLKEVRLLLDKVKELDTKTDRVFELEECFYTDDIGTNFDYWIDIGEPLLEKLKNSYLVRN